MEDFQIAGQARDDVYVIDIRGDLDIVTSRQLDDVLSRARTSFTRIVLDLSHVDFMDTSSLAVIVGHWKSLEETGGSVVLAGARYQSTKSLWITGLADRIRLYDNADAAVRAVTEA